jgi:pimeloyl-ACP methyl ester carboxylesterase
MRILISLLYAGIVLTFQFSCNNAATNAKPASAEKRIIDNRGVRIDYTDTGNGDTTLFFVHGWCINKTYWSDQVNFFSGKYRVVTVDLPGFGQSGKNRTSWSAGAFGSDIDSVLSQLNLRNVVLVGHSMAGDIILQAAINAPDRVIGLVGVDNFKNCSYAPTQQEKEEEAKAIDTLKHNFKRVASEYFNQALFYKTTADSIRKRVLNDVAGVDTVIAAACMEQQDFDEVKSLVAVKKKLYLINSDVTPTDTTGFITNHIPYEVFYIHETGHFPMIEKPREFNLLLEQVMAKIKN